MSECSLVQSFPVVSVLPLLQTAMFAIGFQGGTVYNIPNIAGTGHTSVDAVTFQATCHYIPGLSQAGSPNNASTSGGSARVVTYPFLVDPSLRNVNVTPGM